ncbi:hypothetical protein [Evansella cellulosilytica]|uniref:Uncharacterized protein n=1 Tax=Evansella cellulosilytica (strain ATCC 21833 / DSM 2522 / FERM P-1141 / JCM 9156 / N-4) TaxID=649639 RepID=E6TUS5_EVAC2|nr:hypothetical protein [Evansella cellulosilytica]ADU32077.1 hypothetical protein Bcell_3838 [Evansella cellulosilytica DSM 2522]
MSIYKKSIHLPLKSVSLMYYLNFSSEQADQRTKRYKENKSKHELIVYKTGQNNYLLIEGYEKYFSLLKKDPNVVVKFVIGDYASSLEARYAAVRELLTYERSAWITKMQQFKILHVNYKQSKNTLASKLGIPFKKVEHYLLDDAIPIKIRAKAAECESGQLANAICRSTLNERMKTIMYEFITYPPKHMYRLTNDSWKLARTMILANMSELMKLSNNDIRFLIVRHAIEFRKRSKENFSYDMEKLQRKTPIPLFKSTYIMNGKQHKKSSMKLRK